MLVPCDVTRPGGAPPLSGLGRPRSYFARRSSSGKRWKAITIPRLRQSLPKLLTSQLLCPYPDSPLPLHFPWVKMLCDALARTSCACVCIFAARTRWGPHVKIIQVTAPFFWWSAAHTLCYSLQTDIHAGNSTGTRQESEGVSSKPRFTRSYSRASVLPESSPRSGQVGGSDEWHRPFKERPLDGTRAIVFIRMTRYPFTHTHTSGR